ncbi:MAG: VanZ family protein [Candidatus Aenigmarchaeota archaeon]|nr:VanZ family protein [Candidatus Aenigmarchaeota archaeon]
MENNRKFYAYLALALAETLFLLWFSFLPSVPTVRTDFLRGGDIEHFIAYLVYGLLWGRVFSHIGAGRRKVMIMPILIGFFVGTACESIQLFVPARMADIIDIAVDTAGAAFGAWISFKKIDFKLWYHKNLLKRSKGE